METIDKSNTELWNKVRQPPATALKKITGGRLNGKTDINPMWRYYAMTEIFGPCGIGWYFTVNNKWVDDGSEGQKFAFADITLYIKIGEEWSQGIPGSGGSMLIEKEKLGLHSNDEAFKMSITDALGAAMKMLGLAADIYAGKWDGSKYKDDPAPTSQEIPPKTNKEPDVPEHIGGELPTDTVFAKIKSIESKDGATNGKAWKVYFIQTATDKYGTFDTKIADFANTLISSGEMGRLQWKQGRKAGTKEVISLSL